MFFIIPLVSPFKSFAFTRSVLLVYIFPRYCYFSTIFFTDSQAGDKNFSLPCILCMLRTKLYNIGFYNESKGMWEKHFSKKIPYMHVLVSVDISYGNRIWFTRLDYVLTNKFLEDFVLKVYHLQILVSIHVLFCRLKCSVFVLYYSFKLKWENLRNTIFWGCGFFCWIFKLSSWTVIW